MRSLLTTLKESALRLVSKLMPSMLRGSGEQHEAIETARGRDAGCDCAEPGACGRTCAAGDSGAAGVIVKPGSYIEIQTPRPLHMKHSEILKGARKLLEDREWFAVEDAILQTFNTRDDLKRCDELLDWIETMLDGKDPFGWLVAHYPEATTQDLIQPQIDYLDRLIGYLESLGK